MSTPASDYTLIGVDLVYVATGDGIKQPVVKLLVPVGQLCPYFCNLLGYSRTLKGGDNRLTVAVKRNRSSNGYANIRSQINFVAFEVCTR